MKIKRNARIVADGCGRARDAAEPAIRTQVEREYAQRLAAASPLQRLLLRREMRRQIASRVEQVAPLDGLY